MRIILRSTFCVISFLLLTGFTFFTEKKELDDLNVNLDIEGAWINEDGDKILKLYGVGTNYSGVSLFRMSAAQFKFTLLKSNTPDTYFYLVDVLQYRELLSGKLNGKRLREHGDDFRNISINVEQVFTIGLVKVNGKELITMPLDSEIQLNAFMEKSHLNVDLVFSTTLREFLGFNEEYFMSQDVKKREYFESSEPKNAYFFRLSKKLVEYLNENMDKLFKKSKYIEKWKYIQGSKM